MRTLNVTKPAVSIMWLITERVGKATKPGKPLTLSQLKVIDSIIEKSEDGLKEKPTDKEKPGYWKVKEYLKTKDIDVILEEAEFDFLKGMLVDDDEFDFAAFRSLGDLDDAKATRKAVFALIEALKEAKEEKPEPNGSKKAKK